MSTSNSSVDSLPPTTATRLDSRSHRRAGWGFWLSWTLATGAGWTIGLAVLVVFSYWLLIFSAATLAVGFGVAIGVTIGVSTGVLQGIILHWHGVAMLRWLRANLIGSAAAGAFGGLLVLLMSLQGAGHGVPLDWIILSVMAGLILGYFQREALQQQTLQAKGWELISAGGWALGGMLSVIVGIVFNNDWMWLLNIPTNFIAPQAAIVTLLCACSYGLTGGAITGYPLMRMLQQSSIQNPKSEIQNESSSPDLGRN